MSAKSSSVQRWIKRLVVVVIVLAVGSLVGVLTATPRPAEIEPAPVVAAEEADLRRSIDAYAARYTGMAERYAGTLHVSGRATDAYAARCAGLARFHDASTEAGQRSLKAYAARCTGMAERYAGKIYSSQRAISAYAARCAGLAEHYASTGE